LIPATPFEPTARVLIGFGKPDGRDVKMCSVVFRGPCLLLNRANREGSCFRAAQALWAIQASSALRFLTRSIDWLTATGSSTSPARSSEPSRRIVGEAGDQNHHRAGMPKSSSITRGAVRPAFGSQIIWSGFTRRRDHQYCRPA
jgi:hypothetical protein